MIGILLTSVAPALAGARPESAGGQAAGDPKVRFAEALKLYKAGKHTEALAIFREVADATKSPNALLYMGHCLMQLGKRVDAYKAFGLTLKEIGNSTDDKYEPTREAAQAQLAILNVRVAKVVISMADIPSGLVVTLDGLPVDEKDLGSSIVVDPGTHRVEASASGMVSVRRDLSLEGGEVKTTTLSLKRAEEPAPVARQRALPAPSVAPKPEPAPVERSGGTTRTMGYVVSGVGVAGMAVFAIFGLSAKSSFNRLKGECGATGCADPDHLKQIDQGKSQQTVANIGLVAGAVGLGTGAMLILLGGGKQKDPGASVGWSTRGGLVSYEGRF